jgi:hypothetical protein
MLKRKERNSQRIKGKRKKEVLKKMEKLEHFVKITIDESFFHQSFLNTKKNNSKCENEKKSGQ